MIVTQLKLKNFMNVAECDLAFKEGINVIGGSNGMGKSTLFAAQAFCLVGSKRGDSWKDFIKIGSASMSIDMELYKFKNDSPMLFHIEGSSSSSSMVREIRYKDEYARNVECDAFLTKYFDLDMMENILFHLQDSSSITNITPSKRREILKKIFNSDFSDVVDKIKEDITTLKDKNKDIESKLEIMDSLKFELSELEPVPDVDMVATEKEANSLQDDVKILNDMITTKKTIASQLQSSKSDLEKRSADLLKKETTLKAEIERIQGEDLHTSLNGYRIQSLNEKKAIELLQVDLDKELANFEQTSKPIKEMKENQNTLYTLGVTQKAILNGLQKQLSVFDTSSTCPTCGQSCSSEHKGTIEKQVQEKEVEINITRENYAQVTSLITENEKLEKDIKTNIDIYRKSITEKETNVKILETKIENTKNQITEREKSIVTNTEWLEKTIKEKEEVNSKLSEIQSSDDGTKMQSEILVLLDNIKVKESKVQELKTLMKSVETVILLNKEKTRVNEEVSRQEKLALVKKTEARLIANENKVEISELDYVRAVFDSELPNHIMNKACLFLQNGINDFMASTHDNFQVQLTQNAKGIEFFYKARNEPEWLKAKMASGFESSLLTLAFKFTVALAYDSKFIIFDEPDKAADENSSLKLIQTITNVEGFNQIFITTHRPQALNYLQENGANILMVNNGEYTSY